jgi:hypothetical protein
MTFSATLRLNFIGCSDVENWKTARCETLCQAVYLALRVVNGGSLLVGG